jgi:hypothetical protein
MGQGGRDNSVHVREFSLKDSAKSVVNTVVVKAAGGFKIKTLKEIQFISAKKSCHVG